MEPESPLQHTKHIFRAAFLLLFVIVVLVLGRGLFVPESWGEHGWYRADSVQEHRNRPVRHGGNASCDPCHEEQLANLDAGSHKAVHCELCHDPVINHISDGEVIAAKPIASSFELCTRCHRYLNARPAGFPQVKPRQHLEEQGGEPGDDACVDCHDPHQPL